jgi:hypothetical protein
MRSATQELYERLKGRRCQIRPRRRYDSRSVGTHLAHRQLHGRERRRRRFLSRWAVVNESSKRQAKMDGARLLKTDKVRLQIASSPPKRRIARARAEFDLRGHGGGERAGLE